MRSVEQIGVVPADVSHGNEPYIVHQENSAKKDQQVNELVVGAPLCKYNQSQCKQVEVVCSAFYNDLQGEVIYD